MLRYVKNGMLLLSVAYIVIGMLLLIMPETSLLWICNIFGVVVLVTGIVCLIQYARIRGTGFTAPFMLVGGVITEKFSTFVNPQVRRHHGGAGHLHAGKAAGSDQLSAHCVRHLHRC